MAHRNRWFPSKNGVSFYRFLVCLPGRVPGYPMNKTQNEISIITSGDLTEAWNHGDFF